MCSDILVGAQSSFSWLAFLLHHGLSMGPVTSCAYSVPYNKDDGVFDQNIFLKQYEQAKDQAPKFNSLQDCQDIQ